MIEQFPDEERIDITENVFIHKSPYENTFSVWLKVDCQYFQVGMPADTETDARWHASMLVKALKKLKANEENRRDLAK